MKLLLASLLAAAPAIPCDTLAAKDFGKAVIRHSATLVPATD